MKVSEALKAMMKGKGLTQAEVAERIGKNQNSVAMYLKNADSMRLDTLMKLTGACGYDVVLVARDGKGSNYALGDCEEGYREEKGLLVTDGLREMVRKMIREELAANGEN